MYLTYDEYVQMGGTEIAETAFENLEFEARTQVDYYTYNRLVNEEEFPEAVKRCMFKLIELLRAKEEIFQSSLPTTDGTTAQVTGIDSQSNDGVSISYNVMSASEIIRQSKNGITTIISRYLGNVRNSLGQKVLYRGIYPNE